MLPPISPTTQKKGKIMEITANWRISVNKRSVASHHFTMVGCLSGTFTKDAIGWTVIETYGARSYIM